MTKQDLYDGLFELIDIWTPGVDKEEYVGFLDLLREKLRLPPAIKSIIIKKC